MDKIFDFFGGFEGDNHDELYDMAMKELEGFAEKVSDSRDARSLENMIREGVRAISTALDYIGTVENLAVFENSKLGKLLEALLDKIAYVVSAKVNVMETEGRSDARIRGLETVLARFTSKGGKIWSILMEYFPEVVEKIDSFICELEREDGLRLSYSHNEYWGRLNVFLRERRTGRKMSKLRAREISRNGFDDIRESDVDPVTRNPKPEIIVEVAEVLKWGKAEIDEAMRRIYPEV